MGKFEDVTDDVYEMLRSIIKDHFPELVNAGFKILLVQRKKHLVVKFVLLGFRKQMN